MTDIPAFTVIDLTEWSLLFVNGKLVDQSHSTELFQIEREAKHESFTLTIIDAVNTPLDKKMAEEGEASPDMTLDQITPLLRKRRS